MARAVPIRVCGPGASLDESAGAGYGSKAGRKGGGEDEKDEKDGSGRGGGGGGAGPRSRFVVMAKVRFPIASTPQWIIRFVIRTMAPIIITKVSAY